MRKRISLLLCAALLLSLTGCAASAAAPENSPAPTAEAVPAETPVPAPETGRVRVIFQTVRDDGYSEDGEQLLLQFASTRATVALEGNPAAAAAINAVLEEADRAFSETPEGEAADYNLVGRRAFLEAAREDLRWRTEENMADSFERFYLERTGEVTRGDERVLSISFLDETYAGGVHGYCLYTGWNFDAQTGAVLTLDDLAEDPESFRLACAERMREICGGGEYAMLGLYDDYEDTIPDLLRENNWYFDDEGLTVLANAYELAPYVSGLIRITLPYEWLRWHIRPEYLPPDRSTAGQLTVGWAEDESPAAVTVDDGTDGQGPRVRFTAQDGPVRDLSIRTVSWWDASGEGDFHVTPENSIAFISVLEAGESLDILTWIPEIMPRLAVTWTDEKGLRQTRYITESGRDGSVFLMESDSFPWLPMDITDRLPFSYDVDGDGHRETLTMDSYEAAEGLTRRRLLVNGREAAAHVDSANEPGRLWLCDLNYDGVAELFYTWDMGSDDYRTVGWYGDSLMPIAFAGEDRYEAEPLAMTSSVEGRLVFSAGFPVIEGWNYQLGTYACTRAYALDENGVMVPWDDTEWTYRRNTQVLTVAKYLPVVLRELGAAMLSPGDTIRLTGARGGAAYFVTGDGEEGNLSLNYRPEEGGWLIDGLPETDYFEFLPYAG